MTPAQLGREIGAKIVQLRALRHLQQYRLAERVGITKGYLSAVEAGKRIPSIPMILAFADALGVEPRDLVAGIRRK